MDRGLRLKSLAQEPLVHFLLAGLLVFGIASWRGTAVDPADRTIKIDEDRVGLLAQQFEQTWQRSPSGAEVDQLIRDYVREEIYYREALRMGLDQDDPIIRRRLRSKMEFLAASQVESAIPTDAELQAWMARNPGRYAPGSRYSFDQVYIGPANDPDIDQRVETALARLRAGAVPTSVGQPLSVPARLEDKGVDAISNDFGDGFAAALRTLKSGDWSGPIASGFGMHLVRITQITPGTPPQLADVRQRVENDWRAATLEARQAKAYQALLDGYSVQIKKP